MNFLGRLLFRRESLALFAFLAGFFSFRLLNHLHGANLRKSYSLTEFFSPGETGGEDSQQFISKSTASSTSKLSSPVYTQEDELFDKVRVLCWIMTNPKNYDTKAVAVKETWGPRCNKLLFMSSTKETSLPTIALPVEEGRNNLWTKSRLAWHYVYKYHGKDYDWFLKADDDTFVILENLRYLASTFNPDDHHYLGRLFVPYGGYTSGGAGYAISRKTLNEIGPVFATSDGCKSTTGGIEDLQFGICLRKIGVQVDNTRDQFKHRFHPFVPEHLLIPNFLPKDFWFWQYSPVNTTDGPGCCSDLTVSFHYVDPSLMRELFFYVYNLHAYGDYRSDVFKPVNMIKREKRLS